MTKLEGYEIKQCLDRLISIKVGLNGAVVGLRVAKLPLLAGIVEEEMEDLQTAIDLLKGETK